jgi:peptide/nickel transport system substrate-binding protein
MPAAFASGRVQLLPALPAGVVAKMKESTDALIYSAVEESLLHLQPDLSVPVLADLRVRRGILHALDREPISHTFANGLGRIAHTFRPEEATDFARDVARVPYSVRDAKRLFAEAGGPPALKLIVTDQPAGSGHARAAELVEGQLRAAGVKLEKVVIPTREAFATANRAQHGGLLLHTRRGDRRLARFFNLPSAAGGIVDTRTVRPHFGQELIDLNRHLESTLFPERRALLSMRMQRIFAETLPLIPIAFGQQISGYPKSLEGFNPGQSGSSFWNVETWRFDEGNGVARVDP